MEKKTPEEKTRESLNKIKQKLNKEKKNPKFLKTALIFFSALAAIVVLTIFMINVKVTDINVTGDLRAYNETRVVQASEISIGKSIFGKSAHAIKQSIRKNIPLADEIKVRKNIFTGNVNIEISFKPFDFYIQYKKAYYAVDENLVVVDIRKSENDFASLGGTLIEIPKICEPVFGEALVFYDTVENPDGDENFNNSSNIDLKDKSAYDYIFDILAHLKASDNYDELTSINLKEKYDIVGVYSGRFKVDFGSNAGFDIKLGVLSEILADTSWQHSEFGVIDLRNSSAATAKAVGSIEEDTVSPEDEPDENNGGNGGGFFDRDEE